MDSNEQNKVIAFDTLFSSNHISMLKIMLPYLDNQAQKSLAVYIKFLELNYTIDFYKKHPHSVCSCMEKEASPDMSKLCEELLPYCTEAEKGQLEQIRSIIKNMEMYREMSKTMEMMKDIMPDAGDFGGLFTGGNSANQAGSPDVMNMLMHMLTPEQKEMFDLFGGKTHDE